MTRFYLSSLFTFISFFTLAQSVPFVKAHTYRAGGFNQKATGQIAYDHTVNKLYSVNQEQLGFDIIDYTDIFKPNFERTVDLSQYLTRVRSIESSSGFVFIAGDGSSAQLPGKLLIYNSNGVFRKQLSIGAKPDRMKFTGDDITLVICNEGSPDSTYSADPIGSVNIINTAAGINFLTQADVKTLDFTLLDTTDFDPLIHIYNNAGQNPSQDLEPEAVSFSPDNRTAYVVLQENNALAVVDLFNAELDTILGLGYRDHNASGLDASDLANTVNITNYPRLYGIHQPGDIAGFEFQGHAYHILANQGEPRRYQAYDERIRVSNQPVDPSKFSNLQTLLEDTLLGRLNISSAYGDRNGDGLHDSLLSFGSRSISIRDSSGAEVWHSTDLMGLFVASLQPSDFNAAADDNSSFKQRSDDMGIEPNAVVTGEVDGNLYAFVSLYQMGGIMIFNISTGPQATIDQYHLDRDFSLPANDPMAGDLGPTDLEFVPAGRTPLGIAQLFVANEVSGTISVYQIGQGIGIEENPTRETSGVYPNPGEGLFFMGKKSNYEVYNQQGQAVAKFSDTRQVDLSDQPPGIYIIVAGNGSAVKVVKR